MNLPIFDFLRKTMEKILAENAVIFEDGIEESEESFDECVSQDALEQLPVYQTLRESVQEGMTLDELIDAFAAMCRIPVGEPDDLLFETGTFDFTGKARFYFSLVRQFQYQDEEEYVQLHLDVRYAPSNVTAGLSCTEWAILQECDFFDTVRSSAAYRTVKGLPIAEIEVYIEET